MWTVTKKLIIIIIIIIIIIDMREGGDHDITSGYQRVSKIDRYFLFSSWGSFLSNNNNMKDTID